MSLYNALFGRNLQSDLLLAVIELRQVDVERFRDVHSNADGSEIYVYTRTGGNNRSAYPNLAMRKRPEWNGNEDDDFDSTYCTDTFLVPEQWRSDVANLSDVLENGLRKEFAKHLAATLNREPTGADIHHKAYQEELEALRRTDHFKANGHTFVPKSDAAMLTALKIAEQNDGNLRTCLGILPLCITVERDFHPYPKAPNNKMRENLVRVELRYEWEIDEMYWKHCQERFSSEYPLTMSKIEESVQRYQARG